MVCSPAGAPAGSVLAKSDGLCFGSSPPESSMLEAETSPGPMNPAGMTELLIVAIFLHLRKPEIVVLLVLLCEDRPL